MPSGGARATSGPPPDIGSLRQQRRDGPDPWRDIPAEGRKGRMPKWPLPVQDLREADLWKEMWRLPQAVIWDELRLYWEVALHVRQMVRCEDGGASAAMLMELRQHAESLGLLPSGMLRNRWRLAFPAEAPATTPKATAAAAASAKTRLTALSGGRTSG